MGGGTLAFGPAFPFILLGGGCLYGAVAPFILWGKGEKEKALAVGSMEILVLVDLFIMPAFPIIGIVTIPLMVVCGIWMYVLMIRR